MSSDDDAPAAPAQRHSVLTGRAGATLWLLCFQFFVAEQVARLHVQGPYSMARNAISDLGALHCFATVPGAATSCSQLHLLMNASFTLQGLLILVGALLIRRLFPAGAIANAAFLSFVLSGAGLFVVGLVPEDAAGQLHVGAATIHFLCGSLAMLLLGAPLLRKSFRAGSLTLAAGAVALTATLLLGLRNTALWSTLGWSLGAVERIAAYPLPIWLTVTGLILFGRKALLNRTRSTQ